MLVAPVGNQETHALKTTLALLIPIAALAAALPTFAKEGDDPPAVAKALAKLRSAETYDSEYVGEDRFTVLVTDDGQPPLSAPVEVAVDVLPVFVERGTCACGGTGAPGGGLLSLWVVLVAVRRRATTR